MRYPYERFIAFLISRKADVNGILERIELPAVGDMGIADRKERMRETAPPAILRYLRQNRHDLKLVFRDGILDWAEKNDIRCLWERQKEFGRKIVPALESASNIFLNPYSRTVLGAMMLAEAPIEELVEVMDQQFSTEVTSDIISYFSSLFWDVKTMGRQGWDEFIPTLDDEQRHVIDLGARGGRPDDLRYAIGAATPSKPKEVLQDILTHAHHQFKQAIAAPHPAAHNVFKWADLATKVVSSMRSGGFGGDGDEPNPRQVAPSLFSITIEEPRIISLDDLDGEIAAHKTALDRAMEDLAKENK
ncbi:hypothetical protein LCGC14_1743920 [marine sediment metagenome]|uniref:Uncharacterized protein n=1 Tax=marine sediment metagenome TaxID=412755 RepID=A0A0F9H5X1_9ZZZZ